jgi:hypothetical protein
VVFRDIARTIRCQRHPVNKAEVALLSRGTHIHVDRDGHHQSHRDSIHVAISNPREAVARHRREVRSPRCNGTEADLTSLSQKHH